VELEQKKQDMCWISFSLTPWLVERAGGEQTKKEVRKRKGFVVGDSSMVVGAVAFREGVVSKLFKVEKVPQIITEESSTHFVMQYPSFIFLTIYRFLISILKQNAGKY